MGIVCKKQGCSARVQFGERGGEVSLSLTLVRQKLTRMWDNFNVEVAIWIKEIGQRLVKISSYFMMTISHVLSIFFTDSKI